MFLIRGLISLYIVLVLVHSLRTWVNFRLPPVGEFWLNRLVEPALRPIRSLLRPLQGNLGVDFSPAVLITILLVIQGII